MVLQVMRRLLAKIRTALAGMMAGAEPMHRLLTRHEAHGGPRAWLRARSPHGRTEQSYNQSLETRLRQRR
jgi:hypothetical protein